MKKTFKSLLFLAAAAMAFTACQTNEVDNIEVSRKVSFSATAESTRTVFGDKVGTAYPTLWTTNQDVKVSYNYGTGKNATVTPSGDQKSAAFTVDIAKDTSVTSHTFYALSPASASVAFSSLYKSGTINIPSSQTATATSCDEAAQILAAKSSTMAAFSTNVNLTFSHVTAYGKMSLTNFTLGASETINSISLTAAENLAGRYYYYYEDYGTQSAGELVANSASKTLSITPATNTTISDIWFACAPADLTSTTLQVVVATTAGTYTKNITMPAENALKFVAGEVSKFSVDMNGITVSSPVEYTLAASLSDLKIGDNVIIAASSYDYAISTTQNDNNRGQAAVTKSGSKISDPAAGVEIFELVEGTVDGTVAFKTSDGKYIYAASSGNNYLRTQGTNNANGSWIITISSGVATVTAQGTYTRNLLCYNNSSSLFSCYSSGQAAIAIFTDGKGSTALPTPTPTVTPTTADATATATTAEAGNGQTATLNGSYVSKNLSESNTVTCGFEYKLSSAESYTSVTATPTNTTPFSVDITGLTTDAEYTFRAWASLDGGNTKVYDATKTFTPTVSSGDVTSKTVTYTVSTTAAVTTSGTAPTGSSATYSQTYNTKSQMTKGNSVTYTLSGYAGATIKAITLSMHSNSSSGAGTLSVKAGTTAIAGFSTAAFNTASWNGAWSQSYVDVAVAMTNANYLIKAGENVELEIAATANSLYCESVTITYEN